MQDIVHVVYASIVTLQPWKTVNKTLEKVLRHIFRFL